MKATLLMSTILENHDFVTIPGRYQCFIAVFIFLLFFHCSFVRCSSAANCFAQSEKHVRCSAHGDGIRISNSHNRFEYTLCWFSWKFHSKIDFEAFGHCCWMPMYMCNVHDFSIWKMFNGMTCQTYVELLCFQSHSTPHRPQLYKMMGLAFPIDNQ